MKQQLDPGTRAAMVDYRLERAHSTLGEADLLYAVSYTHLTLPTTSRV